MITRCYLCNSEESNKVPGEVRDRPDIGIRRCSDCGFIFLDSHKHITESYYESVYSDENHAHQNLDDFLRETHEDDQRRFQQIKPLISGKRFLDVGCGGGGILRKAQGWCSLAAGVEPQTKWRAEMQGRGVTIYSDLGEVAESSFDVVSLFHVLEHIADPKPFLAEIRRKIANGGTLVIEVPNADDALLKLFNCKEFSRFTYWSAHLYLYNPQTLNMLLQQAGFNNWHIQQYQRYPLANHLRWLAKGEPGGHITWSFLNSAELNAAYSAKLAELGLCDTLIAYIPID